MRKKPLFRRSLEKNDSSENIFTVVFRFKQLDPRFMAETSAAMNMNLKFCREFDFLYKDGWESITPLEKPPTVIFESENLRLELETSKISATVRKIELLDKLLNLANKIISILVPGEKNKLSSTLLNYNPDKCSYRVIDEGLKKHFGEMRSQLIVPKDVNSEPILLSPRANKSIELNPKTSITLIFSEKESALSKSLSSFIVQSARQRKDTVTRKSNFYQWLETWCKNKDYKYEKRTPSENHNVKFIIYLKNDRAIWFEKDVLYANSKSLSVLKVIAEMLYESKAIDHKKTKIKNSASGVTKPLYERLLKRQESSEDELEDGLSRKSKNNWETGEEDKTNKRSSIRGNIA